MNCHRWFGDSMPVRDLGYMASEAQMTLPISDAGSAGILDVGANFYEFIPESEIDSAQPAPLTCAELREGDHYYLILTTPGGLYRYDINDVVRVAGFYKRTPLIEFVRKGRDVTNITGEKLHVNQVIQAMAQAQTTAGITVAALPRLCRRDAIALRLHGRVRRTQFRTRSRSSNCSAHSMRNLSQLNIEYAQKRQSQRLKAPVLCVMQAGWFERKASRRNPTQQPRYPVQSPTAEHDAGRSWRNIGRQSISDRLITGEIARNHPFTDRLLAFITVLFAGRVFGQALVAFVGVPWLPPMEQWFSGMIPYPSLLIIQLLMLMLMIKITARSGAAKAPSPIVRPHWSGILMKFSAVYASLMVVRYILTMILHPEMRWFGDIIPIIFHFVLAGFIFVLGRYHRVLTDA